jgi:hypothetical protein
MAGPGRRTDRAGLQLVAGPAEPGHPHQAEGAGVAGRYPARQTVAVAPKAKRDPSGSEPRDPSFAPGAARVPPSR